MRTLLARLNQIKPAPWVAWLVLSTVLFLAGSGSFALAGAHHAAQLGVMGALVAMAMVVTFGR